MGDVEAKVVGIPELLAKLKKWQTIKIKACSDILKRGGFKIETQAKLVCPVKSGRLKGSINTNWSGSGMSEGKINSPAKPGDGLSQPEGKDGLTVVVGTNVKYGPRIEFGFIGTDKLGRKYHQMARHYLFNSYFSYEGEIEKEIAKCLGEYEALGFK